MSRLILLVSFLLSATASAQFPGAASAPASQPIPAVKHMDKETLAPIYQRELGKLYQPEMLDRLYAAHELIERFFEVKTAAEKKQAIAAVEETKLDPNLLGRLLRIRMDWPAVEPGVYYVNEKIGPFTVNYFVGVPKDYDRAKPWPLVIKLPTAHAFVTNPPPTADEVARIYTGWIQDDLKRHPDALVLMPLLNMGELWGPGYPGMNAVIQPIHHAAGRFNIDPQRVYLIGHSMSAHAVWNIGMLYTTYFAAINPMAGSATAPWQRMRLGNLNNVLPVVWADQDDLVVKVDMSRELVRILRDRKCNVEYEETKNIGHVPTEAVVNRCYEKTVAYVRELYPKQVVLVSNRPDTMFNRLDWVQVYQLISPGDDKKVLFNRGNGSAVLYQMGYKLSAGIIKPNAIEIACENVCSMRLYFNEQMIDFAKPVTVIVNRKVRFEGMVKPSVEEMLKDQIFLGRGWRYFTGVVDIDFDVITSRPSTTRSSSAPK